MAKSPYLKKKLSELSPSRRKEVKEKAEKIVSRNRKLVASASKAKKSTPKMAAVCTPKEKKEVAKIVPPKKDQLIEVLVSFDTTGSMNPVFNIVKKNIVQFIKDLFGEVKNLRIGVIAHGDYCDAGSTYVTKQHKLTDENAELVEFVRSVGPSGGGDSAECYELVIRKARDFAWTEGSKRTLILIGDDVPHAAHEAQNFMHLDWREEAKLLKEYDIKCVAVQALNRYYATKFYSELASITGGFHLELDQFSDISDFITAVCHQQAGTLDQFEQKLKKRTYISAAMRRAFGVLAGKKSLVIEGKRETFGKYQVLDVPHDQDIMGFVTDNGLTFQKGRGFYQFTKSVLVQKYKEIVLMDKTNGDIFIGNEARKLIGMPIGVDAQCYPEKNERYLAFIQSTSVNRRLIGGTKFLYEVDLTR